MAMYLKVFPAHTPPSQPCSQAIQNPVLTGTLPRTHVSGLVSVFLTDCRAGRIALYGLDGHSRIFLYELGGNSKLLRSVALLLSGF
jgi:hypothetical protein